MEETKPKRAPRRRVIKAANSPEPEGPVGGGSTCGHGGCDRECRVHFVGPTSHLRDHHALHAARGMTHVWTAAVVTGFAVILTGAIAFNAAQASSAARMDRNQVDIKQGVSHEIIRLSAQIEELKEEIAGVKSACAPEVAEEDSE